MHAMAELDPPYVFTNDYSGCLENPRVAMDVRHIYMTYGILSGWHFNHALEIGSFNGASATSFVEAIGDGRLGRATFCDVEITDSLRLVAKHGPHPGLVSLDSRPSWVVLDGPEVYDFILVDGCHDVTSVSRELHHLLRRKPVCVMAHDTNATAAGYPLAEGARMLKQAFEALPEYRCVEDCATRPGEETQRGLFLATTDPQLHKVALEVFGRLG